MIGVGAFILIIGIVLCFLGNEMNNDIEAQMESIFGDGKSDPGSGLVAMGVIAIVIGAIVLVVGIIKYVQNNSKGQSSNVYSGMYRCPNCGNPVVQGAGYCSMCGSKITVPQIKYCRQCGRQVSASSAFCPHCGNRISKD